MQVSEGWSDRRWARVLRRGRGRPLGILVLLICVASLWIWRDTGPLPGLRLALFDSYQLLLPRERGSAPVTIVAIDETSLGRYGQWPWPRDLIARLLASVAGHGPAAMGLDILFPEPDRLSPDRVPWKDRAPPEVRAWMEDQAGNDALLAEVILQIPLAMGIAGLETGSVRPGAVLAPVQENGFRAAPHLRSYPGELRSLPQFDDAAWGHGLLSVDPDGDGVVRRIPLAAVLGDRIAPSLDLEVLRLAVGANWFTLNGDADGVRSVAVGDLEIPTQSDSSIWIHYTPADPGRFVSAADVLEGVADPQILASKLILIGVTGLGLVDYPATPVAARMPGVEVRAQLLENVFDGSLLSRPGWAVAAEMIALTVLGGLMIWVVPILPPKLSPLLWGAATVAVQGLGVAAYAGGLILLDSATTGVAGTAVFVGTLAAVLVETDHQRALLKRDLELQKEKEAKLAGELDAAKRIQMGILPDAKDLRDSRIDACTFLEPAKDVGGDLYDFFRINEDMLFFLVGDVAGKGIPASLFMALGKSLYKSTALRRKSDIGEIMSEANREIARDNPEMLFITAFAALLDLRTGDLQYCNAGHDAPHRFRCGGPASRLDGDGGPPLCILDDYDYPAERATLSPGDSVLVITDGVTEAMNPLEDLYTAERLDRYVASIPAGTDADTMVQGLYDDIKRFADGADPSDDITIVALTWYGPGAPGDTA